ALPSFRQAGPKPLGKANHLLVCDIDDTLTGNKAAIREINQFVSTHDDVIFGVATGRALESARETLKSWSIAEPQFFISSVGTAIHQNFGKLELNKKWKRHIQFRWQPNRAKEVLSHMHGLVPQEPEALSEFKISYYYENADEKLAGAIKSLLRKNLLQARVVISRNYCVDILPVRASKGHALRFLASEWKIDLDRIIAAGDSGDDLGMLSGMVNAIVGGNHRE